MKTLHFDITIAAPRDRVWHCIVTDAPYREWASVFSEGSHFVGGWQAGDVIRFLGPDKDGTLGGMVSEIAESRKPEFLSIRHLGLVAAGVDDTTSEAAAAWAPSYENYTLTSNADGSTTFAVDVDINEDFAAMFEGMWPKALERLKSVAERPADG